jgi:thiol-disulfide isomerase/thioredoxin
MVLAFALASAMFAVEARAAAVPREAPEVSGEQWINAEPMRLAELRGRVVLVEFWTFACVNCRNVEPYVNAWHKRYADQGLVVIGVHTPELPHERDVDNVRRYVRERGLAYPIVIDGAFDTWRRYENRAWPAMYLIDKRGLIRYVNVGEGDYERTEHTIHTLLGE